MTGEAQEPKKILAGTSPIIQTIGKLVEIAFAKFLEIKVSNKSRYGFLPSSRDNFN
ncbi:MAG: hypothetical protein QXI12_02120 [Candidatus Methanomethyliaceae archaeon]